MYQTAHLKQLLSRIWTRFSAWIPALGLATALVLLGVFAWRDRAALTQALATARPAWLVAALALWLLDLVLVVKIWSDLLRALGVSISFRDHFVMYAQANAGKRLPGTIWYVASRVSLYERRGVSAATIAVASSLEFVVSFATSALFGVLTIGDLLWTRLIPRLSDEIGLPVLAGMILVLAATGVVIAAAGRRLLQRRLGTQLDRTAFRLPWRAWLRLGIGYLFVWLVGGAFLLAITLAVTTLDDPGQARLLVGAWALSSMFAALALLLPSSLAVKELSVSVLAGTALPASTAVLVAVLARVLTTLFTLGSSATVFVAAARENGQDAAWMLRQIRAAFRRKNGHYPNE